MNDSKDMQQEEAGEQTFEGVARNVRRPRVKNEEVTFRLEEVDDAGNVTGSRVVECHAIDTDIVTDGDRVRVVGRIKDDGAILPRKIENRETDLTVEAPSGCFSLTFLLRNRNRGSYLVMAVFVVVLGFILLMWLGSCGIGPFAVPGPP